MPGADPIILPTKVPLALKVVDPFRNIISDPLKTATPTMPPENLVTIVSVTSTPLPTIVLPVKVSDSENAPLAMWSELAEGSAKAIGPRGEAG